MEERKKILVETVLFDAIRAFHDIDDETKRNKYLKEYFEEFCNKTKVNPTEAYEILEKIFKEKRKNTEYTYEYYKDGLLKQILFNDNKIEVERDVEER